MISNHKVLLGRFLFLTVLAVFFLAGCGGEATKETLEGEGAGFSFSALGGNNKVRLNWVLPTGFTNMEIRRDVAGAPADPLSGTLVYTGTESTFDDLSGPVNGSTMYYTAFANDGAGTYGPQVSLSVTPQSPWRAAASGTDVRFHHSMVYYSGKIFVMGGDLDVAPYALSSVEQYDIMTDTWTNCGGSCPPLPNERGMQITGLVGSTVYVVGGGNWSNSYWAHGDSYNLADFSTVNGCCAPVPRGQAGGFGLAVGDKFYMMGGYNPTDLNTVDIYDTANGTWSPGAPMPGAFSEAATVHYNGKIYVIGGYGPSYRSTVHEYDIATNVWTECGGGCPVLPHAEYKMPAVEVGGKIYIIGGGYYSGAAEVQVYEWDVANMAASWVRKADMPTGRRAHRAVAVDGKIYVSGGDPSFVALNTMEIYEPAKDW